MVECTINVAGNTYYCNIRKDWIVCLLSATSFRLKLIGYVRKERLH